MWQFGPSALRLLLISVFQVASLADLLRIGLILLELGPFSLLWEIAKLQQQAV